MIKTKREMIRDIWKTNPFAIAWKKKLQRNKKVEIAVEEDEDTECDHECTSNCRRNGCNCNCGEYHIMCHICDDTGEVSCDERDSDGNWQSGVGTQKCECQLDNEIDMSGATPGDR